MPLCLQMSRQQLAAFRDAFSAFLSGDTPILADEAFCNAARSYYQVTVCLSACLSVCLSVCHTHSHSFLGLSRGRKSRLPW